MVGDKQLWCGGDVECRQAKDSKHAYLLDLARPPEHPVEVKHLEPFGGVVFYRILRPEFLQILKVLKMPPLSADGLSNWGRGPGSQTHNTNIRMATRFLVSSVIPPHLHVFPHLQVPPCLHLHLHPPAHRDHPIIQLHRC